MKLFLTRKQVEAIGEAIGFRLAGDVDDYVDVDSLRIALENLTVALDSDDAATVARTLKRTPSPSRR